jgi:hypothetical protein
MKTESNRRRKFVLPVDESILGIIRIKNKSKNTSIVREKLLNNLPEFVQLLILFSK